MKLHRLAALCLIPLAVVPSCFAWGAKGHRIINHLAIETLPSSIPGFLRSPAALDEITWLGPEPDRWRSPAEPQLEAMQAPDHFIDLELANRIAPLPRQRYQYIAKLYAYMRAHPRSRRQMQPTHVGFQPYITEEVWQRLKAAMRNYRHLRAEHQDVIPVEQAVIFYAGWLGHYVADGSQPLHTTVEYNGWIGPDPHHYTTSHKIHWQFESTFVNHNISMADVRHAMKPLAPINDEWTAYLAYLNLTHTYVDEVYQLWNQHGFEGSGTAASRAFTAHRLAAGADMLRNLIYAAWVKSAEPVPQRRPQDTKQKHHKPQIAHHHSH